MGNTINRMVHYIYEHLEATFGVITGLLAWFHLDTLLAIPLFTDAMTEIVFKFLVAVICGIGGGLGGLAVKLIAGLFKKEEKD